MLPSFLPVLLLLFVLAVVVPLSIAQPQNETIVDCTLCENGLPPNDPSARFNLGLETLTCQTIFERGVYRVNPSNCSFLQNRGRQVCFCGRQVPKLNRNCTLCEDGTALPGPNFEGLPGLTCASVQVAAQRDDSSYCNAHRATLGVYCQCDNPTTGNDNGVCRICQHNQLLPTPLQQVSSNNGELKSCAELELMANRDPTTCSNTQELYRAECCADLEPPTAAPVSMGWRRHPARYDTAFVWIPLLILWSKDML